jgi:hypothetical protein
VGSGSDHEERVVGVLSNPEVVVAVGSITNDQIRSGGRPDGASYGLESPRSMPDQLDR